LIIYLLVLVIIIFIADIKPLIKEKKQKEITTIGIMLFFSLFLYIWKELGLTSPVMMMHELLSPLGKVILRK
jgi:hypothetical protein